MQLYQFQSITFKSIRPKFRTSETKKSRKFAEIWVYGTISGEFTLLCLQFYQSFSISYIEIGVNLNLSQIFGH